MAEVGTGSPAPFRSRLNMTVLNVGYPLLPVGPDSGGGAEQILSLVDHGLAAVGLRSIVIAAKNSRTAGELIASPLANGEISEGARAQAQYAHRELIADCLERYSVDLIHFHGLDFHSYLPARSVPMLATLHLPVAWYPEAIFREARISLNCVSRAQAISTERSAKLPVVANGIDLDTYRNLEGERDSLLWLGRICPEKGVHLAIEIARELDLPMIVAGPVHPFRDHQLYFQNSIQPLLDAKRRYVGAVGLTAKIHLLANARCLLIPSLVAETSSLVAMEATACGTPVIAFRSGALPEIVDHGKTGFIADSLRQMLEAVRFSSDISPEICRATAEVRFDSRRMVSEYLSIYRSVVDEHSRPVT